MSLLKPWRLLARRPIFADRPFITVEADDVELPDGRRVDNFYRVTVPDYVSIVAVTPERSFVMLRQYKHGIGRVSTTTPAGRMEEGEAPLAAAKRELLEETGYEAARWEAGGRFVMAANLRFTTMNAFFAFDVRKIAEPNSGDLEEMEVHLLDEGEIRQALTDGRVADAGSALALSLFLLRPPAS